MRVRITGAVAAVIVGAGLSVAGAVSVGHSASAATDSTVYTDSLGSTWSDWSWSASDNMAATSPVHTGTRSISASVIGQWGALSLHTSDPIVANASTVVSFWVNGGPSGVNLRFFAGNDALSPLTMVPFAAPANVWTQVQITEAQLGNPATISRVAIASADGSPTGTFSIDDFSISTPSAPVDGTIAVNVATSAPFSSRLIGSNMSFYNGSGAFSNSTVRARANSIFGLMRFPGGQDSQKNGFASCQFGAQFAQSAPCPAPWAAKPSDFIGFVRAVHSEPVITLNANQTAKESAAYVAFMNGAIGDTRVIGVDQTGTNWQTVGYWAQQRANAGYPAPLGVTLWEFGNETFGGIGGGRCMSYGWEIVYSCDPAEYLNGLGSGATRKDGYLATKAAMAAVDPQIRLGAPAVDSPIDYNYWTRDLLLAGGQNIDFIENHPYFVWVPPANTPAGNAEILAYPQTHWADVMSHFNGMFDANNGGRHIPVLFSEYNLTAGTLNDPAQRVNTVINGLLESDSIGAMSKISGILGANQFDLFGSPQWPSSYFSMIRNDGSYTRSPQYWGALLWSRFGNSITYTTSSFDAKSKLSAYGGRAADGTISLMVYNKSETSSTAHVDIAGVAGLTSVTSDVAVGATGSLMDTTMSFNGVANPQ